MPFNPEALLERARLKARVRRWRFIALALVMAGVLAIGGGIEEGAPLGKDYIALVEIKGIIDTDREAIESLKDIMDDTHIKAVLLSIDSPGGTAVGGEVYYDTLVNLKQKKPVVALFNNIATSAAYLIATPADRIFAHRATITGSIGALVQFPNVKGLTDKIGVTMTTVKTGDLKGEPTPFTDMSEPARQMLQGMVDDFQIVFTGAISQHRNIPLEEVQAIADGRVFTGQQAIGLRLVDAIGGQDEAVKWLEDSNKVGKDLEVFEVKLKKPENDFSKVFHAAASSVGILPEALSLNGLLSIWPKGAM